MEKENVDEVIIDEVKYINPKGFDIVVPSGKESLVVEPAVQGQDIMVQVRNEVSQVVQAQMEQLETEISRTLNTRGELDVTSKK